MPLDAFVHLDRLRCLAEHDGHGHSEPYLWAVLLFVDDTTIMSGQLVGSSAPGNAAARLVVRDGMRAGDEAPLPPSQRRFAHRFDDGLDRRDLALVVALFEADETPVRAARAGYDAFVREVPRAVVDFALRHGGNAPSTEEERQEVADAVRPAITGAVRGAFSAFEKFQVAVGALDVDDEIGFSSVAASADDGDRAFTLVFRKSITLPPPISRTVTNHYELDGRIELRPPPPPDRCQAEVDLVRRARDAVRGVQAEIAALQAELRTASPAQKPFLISEIRRLRTEDLPAAVASVAAAQQALDLCRSRRPPGRGPIGTVTGGVLTGDGT